MFTMISFLFLITKNVLVPANLLKYITKNTVALLKNADQKLQNNMNSELQIHLT